VKFSIELCSSLTFLEDCSETEFVRYEKALQTISSVNPQMELEMSNYGSFFARDFVRISIKTMYCVYRTSLKSLCSSSWPEDQGDILSSKLRCREFLNPVMCIFRNSGLTNLWMELQKNWD
jgi:hypothetical protein